MRAGNGGAPHKAEDVLEGAGQCCAIRFQLPPATLEPFCNRPHLPDNDKYKTCQDTINYLIQDHPLTKCFHPAQPGVYKI